MARKISLMMFPRSQSALVSPVVDFLMLGGLSLFVLALSRLPIWDYELPKARAGLTVFYLLFVLNLPHFIHGYQLLYPKYIQKLTDPRSARLSRFRYLIAGIVAPTCLVAFLAYGTLQPTHTVLAYAANAVLFLTGWHYVKQGYGVLMTLSGREKVAYSNAGKRLLLVNAYIAWVFSWLQYNAAMTADVYYGIPFQMVPVDAAVMTAAKFAFIAWTIFAAVLFYLEGARRSGVSVNGMLAYVCSIYVWVVFANTNHILLIFVPALHSLQYLLFVWKIQYEKTRLQLLEAGAAAAQSAEGARRAALLGMAPFVGTAVLAGVLFLSLANRLDSSVGFRSDVFGPQYFMFCFTIFLNIHHYFIDFAIWRRDNPEMKYLFR